MKNKKELTFGVEELKTIGSLIQWLEDHLNTNLFYVNGKEIRILDKINKFLDNK